MHKYIALYRKPADPAAFDDAYFTSHIPLVLKTPGLVRAEVAKVARVVVPGFLGDAEPYLIAEMYFESKDAAKAAYSTPEWAASGANLAEIGGLELVAMFTADVHQD
jgi:uncharacterized protein (TIGR02118 family)